MGSVEKSLKISLDHHIPGGQDGHMNRKTIFGDFVADVHAYAARRGLKPSTVTQYAVQNRNLIAGLEAGGECKLSTIERVRAWMKRNPVGKDGDK